jgi:MFS transporter, FSR family, fosmidomycin resistance protein
VKSPPFSSPVFVYLPDLLPITHFDFSLTPSLNYLLSVLNFPFLLIEFLDELVFGVNEAAWPLIRTDLRLSYFQIGLLLSVPGIVSAVIEPFLGILGDVWKRRLLILGGGIFFALACLLTGLSTGFVFLLFALCIFYPSSGAFVSLSQAALMDSDPARHEHNMARWTFAGSLGVVLGPLLLSGMAFIGFGWRGVFMALAGVTVLVLLFAWQRVPKTPEKVSALPRFSHVWSGVRGALSALRRGEVLRWLVLLQFSDLMLDVLLGFLALYFVDVAGLRAGQAALGIAVWSGLGLLGDFLLIPLLEKVRGLDYLRLSVLLELLLFPAFLLTHDLAGKFILLGLLGFFNSGWYAILKGRLYTSMPGQSGTVMTLDNVFGLLGKLLPFGIGLAAQFFGLRLAMWLLLLGPIALLVGLPRRISTVSPSPAS